MTTVATFNAYIFALHALFALLTATQ